MTVLTFPSAGGVKPDKVPLVKNAPQPAAKSSSSFRPKLLESGQSTRAMAVDVRGDRWQWLPKKMNMLLVLVSVLVLIWWAMDAFRKIPWDECTPPRRAPAMASSANSPILQQPDDNDDGGGDNVPYKTYHSYAAAEGDMALPVTTSSPVAAAAAAAAAVDGLTFTLAGTADYDAGQLNDMEDVYKKLEKFALNKALNPKDDSGNDDDDDNNSDDVITVFNEALGVDPKSSKMVQPIVITKSARFIHDFSVNITGIVDVEGQRCFVMPLMRNSVSPPVSLYDLLFKMSSGYYSMDIKKVVGNMRIVKPALKDLNDYGLYISKDCADYSTFKLEKAVGAADA